METSTNETPTVSYRSSYTMEADADHASDASDATDNADTTESSDQIACCWLNNAWTASDLLLGGGATIGGLLTIAAGFLNPGGKPADATTSNLVFAGFGGVLLLIGVAILLLKLMLKSEGIEVTEDGIEWILTKGSSKYRWNEINKVLVTEFTATRLSETETTCQIEPVKGKRFGFRTSYLGDPQNVLECVLVNCDYIVRNPEGFTRNVK